MADSKTAIRQYSFMIAAVSFAGLFATAHAYAAIAGISNITLYPGGATVERQLPIAQGSSRIDVTCLPVSFDPQSLRLTASPDVQIGDFRIEEVTNGDDLTTEHCVTTATEKRIRALQTELAELDARAQAIELSAQYLKSVSEQTASAKDTASMLAASRALQQSGLTVYAQRERIKQQQEDTRRRLDALRGEGGGPTRTRTLHVALDAPRGGTLKIAWETRRAGWIPAYQATLDTASGQMTLERRALVAQATGEDWQGVALQLATSTPLSDMRSPQPRTWRLDLEAPRADSAVSYAAAPPAPVMEPPEAETNAPLFEPTRIDSTFLTAFVIPGRTDVPADGQKVGFTLGREAVQARLAARVVPDVSTRAWLIATASRPGGTWPDGAVYLRRDSASVGETRLAEALHDDELRLPFGTDDQVVTDKADGADARGTVKAAGDTASRALGARYTVKNRHRTPIDVEIVESTPVSDSADIEVTSTFAPQPDDMAWQGHPGIVAWTRTLAPGEEIRLRASYTVRYPGKRRIVGLP